MQNREARNNSLDEIGGLWPLATAGGWEMVRSETEGAEKAQLPKNEKEIGTQWITVIGPPRFRSLGPGKVGGSIWPGKKKGAGEWGEV